MLDHIGHVEYAKQCEKQKYLVGHVEYARQCMQSRKENSLTWKEKNNSEWNESFCLSWVLHNYFYKDFN